MNTFNSRVYRQILSSDNTPLLDQNRFSHWSDQIIKPKQINEENSIFFNACFDKGHVKELVSWFLNEYGEKPTINFLESLKFIGFNQATQAGISLGIEDLEIPPEKSQLITEAHIATHKIEQQSAAGSLTTVEKSQCLIDTWNQTSDLLRQNAIQNFKTRNVVNPVYMMAFSGARGNVSQVRQLVAMRGLMADPQGAILEFPIQSNFREGLTITEYLISCYGARKGLVDTALRTATSGYLTRRLVDSAQHAVIAMIDCGTNRNKNLKGKNLNNRLIGRVLGESLLNKNHKTFFRNHIISGNDATLIAKYYNQVLVRSPLTCEATTSVCQLCYGWNLASGKLVQIGEAVGVIAAQSIGEPGTQLTMRTFHTGGVGVFSDQALKPIFSLVKGKILFSDSIPGHFIRTPHGKIVYMVKYISSNPERVLFRVQPLNSNQRELVIYERDLPPGSLLLAKHGEIVEPKKLIAQSSHLKITKYRLPESSNPVYSPLEGQIFFESMNLLIEKEIPLDLDGSKKKFDINNQILELNNSGLPDLRRVAKIGSFWIFSAYNQHEIQNMKQLIEPGDLVSTNTILFTYKFHSSLRGQLHKIDSQLTLGLHTFQIPINKLSYLKHSYKLFLDNSIGGKFIYHKKDNQNALLIWYPFQKKNLNISSYNHFIPIYNEIINKTPNPITPVSLEVPKGVIFEVFSLKKHQQTFLQPIQQKICKKITKNFISNSFKNNSFTFLPTGLKNITFKKSFLPSQQSININNVNLSKMGWVILTKKKHLTKFPSTLQRQFIPAGIKLDTFCFPKQNISIKHLNNINLSCFKNFEKNEVFTSRDWYDHTNFINQNKKFSTKVNLNTDTKLFPKSFNKDLKLGLIWYSVKFNFNFNKLNNCNLKIYQKQKNYLSFGNFIVAQQTSEYIFPSKKNLQNRWSNFYGKLTIKNPRNFLFSKQKLTSLQLTQRTKIRFKFLIQNYSGWFSTPNFCRIQLFSNRTAAFPSRFLSYQALSNNPTRGLSIYQYNYPTFNKVQKFSFKTYLNRWVLPFESFSSGAIKLKNNGEFRYKIQKTTGTFLSILRNTDLLTLNVSKPNFVQVGNLVRWGQEIESGTVSDHNGQILKKTKRSITIRLGTPILASAHGVIHVFQDDLVFKNQLLITLKSRRLQTEDIVQGIPKIEQLFEARESQGGEILVDTVHIRLRNAFIKELESLQDEHWSSAVEKSFLEAQQFLVDNIVDAYANQGVKISEKHVEVIVRQMTSRVRILESGETGLLPGELVQHTWIRKFNKNIRQIGLREATYEPIVLGISKSVLQSESFLLAASFQEVSRVLVRSALSKKRDFLCGLHENVIVGQLIPAGTGLLTQFNNPELLGKK